eukprot:PhM_4_TR9133/c0_g1_i1/m.34638
MDAEHRSGDGHNVGDAFRVDRQETRCRHQHKRLDAQRQLSQVPLAAEENDACLTPRRDASERKHKRKVEQHHEASDVDARELLTVVRQQVAAVGLDRAAPREVPHEGDGEVEEERDQEPEADGDGHPVRRAVLELLVQRGDVEVHRETEGHRRDGAEEVPRELVAVERRVVRWQVLAGHKARNHNHANVEDCQEGDDRADRQLVQAAQRRKAEEDRGDDENPKRALRREPREAEPRPRERSHRVLDYDNKRCATTEAVHADGEADEARHPLVSGAEMPQLEVRKVFCVLRQVRQHHARDGRQAGNDDQRGDAVVDGGVVEHSREGKDTAADERTDNRNCRRPDRAVAVLRVVVVVVGLLLRIDVADEERALTGHARLVLHCRDGDQETVFVLGGLFFCSELRHCFIVLLFVIR